MIKFEIKKPEGFRLKKNENGEFIFEDEHNFTAEIDCEESCLRSYKRRLAVIWAIKNNADLRHCDLQGSDLSGLDLSNVDFSYSDLSHSLCNRADFNHSNLGHAKLLHCDLNRADMSYCDLIYCDFSAASLHQTDLSYALLFNTKFDHVDFGKNYTRNTNVRKYR